MARTLADLTLKFTRDLSALEARCARQRDEIEQARDEALLAIGLAKKILKQYNEGLAKAKAAQLSAVAKANEIRDKEIRAAEEKRRRGVVLQEQKHRDAGNRAYQAREVTLRSAKARLKEALEAVRERPLPEQRALRKAAEKAYEDAVQDAQDTYQDDIDAARVAHQSALQDLLTEERMTVEAANRTAERMITAAVVAYERAIAQEETRMRGELAADAEARRILEDADRRLGQLRRACEREKEELFRRFSEDRKKLKA